MVFPCLFQGTGHRTRKRKAPSATSILSTQNPEVGSTQMTESETDPRRPALKCTCCFGSSTNTSINSADSTVSLPSSNPSKRETLENHIHTSKRKLFVQTNSPVVFTPVSEGEKQVQSSHYLYIPILQLNQKNPNNRSDARGYNSGVRVAELASAHKESQQNKDIAAHDTRESYVVVHNTEHSFQSTDVYQEKEVGKSDGSFGKENTCKEEREENLLEVRSVSQKPTLHSTALHVNCEASKTCSQELQICLVRCDSSNYVSQSSSSVFHLDTISDGGTEVELNVPDSTQEMTDDEDNEVGTCIKNIYNEEQTVFCKESDIKITSVKGGKEGQILYDGIHESMSCEGNEVQQKSVRQILQDHKVMKELPSGSPQDEIEVHYISNSEEITNNSEQRTQNVIIYPETHSDDKFIEGGSDIPMSETYEVYEQNSDQLRFSNSITEMLTDGVHILADNEFEILNLPDITLSADGNQQESSISYAEFASEETAVTRISSLNSRTSNNTDFRVDNCEFLDLPVEKRISSTSQNVHIICSEFADKGHIGPLSVGSSCESAQSQTQASLCSKVIETGQTVDSKSSGVKNPHRKSSVSSELRENGEKHLSQDVLGSSSDRSDKIVILQKCEQKVNCINSTDSAENNAKLDDLLSQRERPPNELLLVVNTLRQTHEISTTHLLLSNSSLSSCMERSCEITPENIIADAGQQSPSQECSSSSSPPSEESAHNQESGNFFLF
jgi:hypothetical protein